MTEAEQIKALKERLEHWQHKFDELAAENDRLRAENEKLVENVDYRISLTTNLTSQLASQIDETKALRAELESIKARVPSDEEMKERSFAESGHRISGVYSGARWMRDRIFPSETK